MQLLNSLRGRFGAAAFALTAMVPLSSDSPVGVTRADVEWSNDKVAMAYGALAGMWQNEFRQIGERFATPRIMRYRGVVRTPCGLIQPGFSLITSRNPALAPIPGNAA